MADDSRDETSFEASEKSVKFATKGSAAARAGHSLLDLISPFTEVGGAFGDVVRYFRQEMAIRATQRSLEIAETLNIPIKPVPTKFLVDWVEKASLEAPDDKALTELWGGLLTSAGINVSPAHYQFKRILAEMTSSHVELLSIICEHNFNSYEPYIPNKEYSAFRALFDQEKERAIPIKDLEVSPVEILDKIEGNTLKVEKFRVFTMPKFSLDQKTQISRVRTAFSDYTDSHVIKHFIEAGVLERINRTVRVNCEALDNKLGHYLEFDALHMTAFGLDFLEACVPTTDGKIQKHKGGSRPNNHESGL